MSRFYRINARLSADNGAYAPLKVMIDLADLLDTKVLWGAHYGQDYIRRPASEEERQLAESLMAEAKLVYTIEENIQSFHPYSYENSLDDTPRS
ncbi:hypothetical protein KTD31_02955 [Burkholderia multivorans]|uniref:hypothetical protein n=1 Tax=Burkholderia multivorans TaxID=87883 RepID=UPI001C215230|nr:hypothetical protein [Burkholderia multivorans]MBU9200311.1 hypothetical protein [Burkholderia multivorans]MDN8078563.1 hypothetical protein [Burkholderia multivorans]